MLKLSERMQGVADLLTPGKSLADIGTDHGYLPIYMVTQRQCPFAIAMDVKLGPLQRAKEHIIQYGLEPYIETRLSDGLSGLAKGEVQSILIAGMGGSLILRIVEQGMNKLGEDYELILQPQSEIQEVRKYLRAHGMMIQQEDMILEEGKFYPMMRVIPGNTGLPYSQIEERYGRYLLQHQNPVLIKYLHRERRILLSIAQKLDKEKNPHRLAQIGGDLKQNGEALTLMKEEF